MSKAPGTSSPNEARVRVARLRIFRRAQLLYQSLGICRGALVMSRVRMPG